MLNFRTNNEAKFTDASGGGVIDFGLKQFANDKTFFFSFESLGGVSIASFFAVLINNKNQIYTAVELDVNLFTYANNYFYCLSGQDYTLQSDAIYYFQIIDNLGNVYNSEPFLTFETPTSLEVVNVTSGGSLAVQTSELFNTDNSLLYFGLKQFSRFETAQFNFKAIQNDSTVESFEALQFDKNKFQISSANLNTSGISIASGIINVSSINYDFESSAIYCFRIITDVAVYYSEYFNTLAANQVPNNIRITFDLDQKVLINTLLTFDGDDNSYFDFSQ